MKTRFNNTMAKPAAAIALAVAGLLAGGAAQAAGTPSNTDISNLATLNYSVGGTAQTAIGSSVTGNTTGTGTATTFKVDNKVNLTLVETSNAVTSVVPGSLAQVTTFTLTNTGNTAQGYTFAALNASGLAIAGTSDTIDISNLTIRVEGGGGAGYQPASDTAGSVLTLAPDASIVVYVLADIPLTATNGQQANITLTATTTNTGTAVATVETTGANTAGVDVVFADAATTELEFVGSSPARDGQATARDAYKVVTATLRVAKTVAPVCDPFNGNTNPKNIPGSFVRYTITVTNSGATSATLTTITDSLVGQPVALDANLIVGATAATCVAGGAPTSAVGSGFMVTRTGGARTGFPKYYTTATADAVDVAANVITATFNGATAPILPAEAVGTGYALGELKTGESVSLVFQVQIN